METKSLYPDDYSYRSDEAREVCSEAVVLIRKSAANVVVNIVNIGNQLTIVKDALSHGEFGPWLQHHFGWTWQTANNYMNAARVCRQIPSACELQPETLYLLTSKVPDDVVEKVVEERLSPQDAKKLIAPHTGWRREIDTLMQVDPGAAYHEIEKALRDPDRGDLAKEALVAHAVQLGLYADRDPGEILAEAGVNFEERFPDGQVNGSLVYYENSGSLVYWEDGKPYTVAEFAEPETPMGETWRNKVLRLLKKELGIRTYDDKAVF